MKKLRSASALALAIGLSLGTANAPALAGKVYSWSTWEECQLVLETMPHRGATVWVGTCTLDAEGRWYIAYHKISKQRVRD